MTTKYNNFWMTLALCLSLLLLAACGGSKQSAKTYGDPEDEYDEIEKLLGINSGDEEETASPGDDDLLKLLESDKDTSSDNVFDLSTIEEIGGNTGESLDMDASRNEFVNELEETGKDESALKSSIMEMKEEVSQPAAEERSYIAPVFSGNGASLSDYEYESQYQQALSLFNNYQYSDAKLAFEQLLSSATNHSLSDNCQYWIGECEFQTGNYNAAIIAFEKVFTFTQSNKNEDAQYKLGLSYFLLKEYARARQEFQSLIDNYGNSRLISKAEQYLSKL